MDEAPQRALTALVQSWQFWSLHAGSSGVQSWDGLVDDMSRLIPRRIYDIALERQRESPVVLLEGSRVVGKSRLLRQLTDHLGGQLLDLDDLDTRAAVTRDPATMIAGDGPVLIDEYQHAPVVLDAIKAQLNISSRPGHFILTGSAHHESLPRAAQALTGRLQRLPILPLAQSELTGTRPDLVRQLIDASSHARAVPPSTTSREDYVNLVVRGGFHIALAAPSDRARWR